MTLGDCEKAVKLARKLEAYQAGLEALGQYDYLDCQPIETGRGTETINVHVPREYMRSIVVEEINNMKDELKEMGVEPW
jgi:hypothetical protein